MISAYVYRRCRCLSYRPLETPRFQLFLHRPRFQSSDRPPQGGTRNADGLFLPLEDDNPFSGDGGLWPASSKSSTPDDTKADGATQDPVTSRNPLPPRNGTPAFFTPLLPSPRPNKHDLSVLDPMQRWSRDEPRTPSSPFRADSTSGFREIMVNYVTLVEPRFQDLENSSQDPYLVHGFYRELSFVFREKPMRYLRDRNYEPSDVVSWAWVVTAPTVSHSIRRYIALLDDLRKQNKPFPPKWIPLQILRVDYINATSFTSLLSAFLQEAKEHPLHVIKTDDDRFGAIAPDSPQARTREWQQNSPMILAVRLIRHARNVAPAAFDDIIRLISMWLFDVRHGEDFERLAFSCNRLLTLLSLPCYVKPYRSVGEQQKAQLSLLRRMMAQNPPIELSREGYQALIKVQLVHEKTEQERKWAETKSAAWPPWRKAKLGIEDQMNYPGQESRAMKMLRRMVEAGYAHGPWEKAATVLAGWDTDKSPTIQTRRVMNLPPLAPATADLFSPQEEIPDWSASLWTSRITATRSIREAWACFMTYRRTVENKKNELGPYQAMFEKLLARPQAEDLKSGIMAGDAKETFADPVSSRDLVYLEEDVPSAKEFYALMMSDGIKPAGRLLSLLVRNAKTLDEGVQYIKNCRYDEMRKDVLLNAGKYPDSVIRDTISSTPNHFFAAFLDFLFRSAAETSKRPYSVSQERMEIELSDQYGLKMMLASQTTYLPAYNAALAGLYLQLNSRGSRSSLSKAMLRAIWNRAWTVVRRIHEQDVEPNMDTFHKYASIVRCYLRPPRMKWTPKITQICSSSKTLFATVVYGSGKHTWLPSTTHEPLLRIPDPEHIRLLVEVLGLTQDIDGIFELAIWMSEHADALTAIYREMATGEQKMQQTLLVMRLFLEGSWAEDHDWEMGIRVATREQMAQVEEKLKGLPWASTEAMADFLAEHHDWVAWVRRAIWNTHQIALTQSEQAHEKGAKAKADGKAEELTPSEPGS